MQSIPWKCLFLAVLTVPCACSSPPKAATPEQELYLSRVEATPLEFTVPEAKLDEAIDRAVEWLARYADLEFTEDDRTVFKQLIRDTRMGLLSSPMKYHVSDLGSQAYAVAFALEASAVKVGVRHAHEGGFGLDDAVARKAHVLAHYVRTGELMPELVER